MRFSSTMLKSAAAATFLAGASPALATSAMSEAYRFELVGSAVPTGPKQHAISVQIVRSSDNRQAMGAAVISVRLDMGPENMASMTAPIREIPNTAPGVYTFSFDDNMVWTERAKWALTITAKVKGKSKPVTGSVIIQAGQ